jgi:hypothetical protein
VLYGLTLTGAGAAPFRRLPGWMRFFLVPAAPDETTA